MAKISVIIPVYNVEKYLKECLDSVVNQTFKDIEIICVNDGSTDSSAQILEDYSKKDSRIKVITKPNGGVSSARNVGLDYASGDLVYFLDSDDYIELTLLEKALNIFSNNDIDYYCFSSKAFLDSDEIVQSFSGLEDYILSKFQGIQQAAFEVGTMQNIHVWNKVFKTSIIKENNINFIQGLLYEDIYFTWYYFFLSKKIYFDKETLHHYRVHSNSIMEKCTSNKTFETAIPHLYNWHHLMLSLANNIELFKENFENLQNLLKFYTNRTIEMAPCEDVEKIKQIETEYKNELNKMVTSFYERIFSVKNIGIHKQIMILGIKFKIKNKKKILEENLNKIYNKIVSKSNSQNAQIDAMLHRLSIMDAEVLCSKNLIFDLYLDSLIPRRINTAFNLDNYLLDINTPPEYLCIDSKHNYLNILLNQETFEYRNKKFNTDKTLISWEMARWQDNLDTLLYSIQQNKNIIFIGDSFLRSINTMADKNAKEKYRKGISFGIDDMGYYYDATRTNRMEQMLNDKNLVISEEQKQRARNCIGKIVKTHLTKYNHQPIFEPKIGREGVKKVLVVDQTYGDMSITKGLADEETFKDMLQTAIRENPNADIIVKTHPDTIAGAGGYYTGLKPHDNIYTQTEPINPISLIKYVDKVYVCTTQFGFEALMCGKEVHVFGMPFYAGWGLTQDRQKCERRTNVRTLEEVFYIAYIMYSYYVNPDKKCRCEIEEAMDYLLKLRDEYLGDIKEVCKC